MADNNTPTGQDIALQADEGVSMPRMRLGEVGFAALKTRAGKMQEESNMAFRYPQMLKVVAEMKYSPPVTIGLGAINVLMNRADVCVEPVPGETEQDKFRREYLYSVLHDMTESWQATMQSISTYKEYGHQVSEMVFRRRLTKNGSKFQDGLIGLEGLKNRPQNSIAKWNFSEDGRTLVSISQSITNVENSCRFQNLTDKDGYIVIPREKFILFRCDPVDDNPEGVSILRSAYLAYKQLSLLTDHMLTGVAKSVNGIPVAQLPPNYMNPEGSDNEKATYANAKTVLDSIADGTAHSIIFPKMIDQDSKQDLFTISVLDQKATKIYDVESIVKMLQANILSVLSCDSLTMGDAGGSLSLQDGSTNMLALTVAYRLSEIANTLNQQLVPLLWKMNGWSTDRLPKLKFKDVSSVSLEEFSKFFQRVAAVGGIEYTRDVLNKVREVGGFDLLPEDMPVDVEKLSTSMTGKESGSGEGLATGSNGDGTSKAPTKQDNSAKNVENKG